MAGYDIALFLHLLSLLAAVAAATLATFGALRVRAVGTADEARQWVVFVSGVARVFPLAALGLFLTGAYMTQSLGGWLEPWADASLLGLVAIGALGGGIEGRRYRALRQELEAAGLSAAARRMIRDPVVWAAKGMTLTLLVAIVYIMTAKPAALGCVIALGIAVVAGILGAMPFRGAEGADAVEAAAPHP